MKTSRVLFRTNNTLLVLLFSGKQTVWLIWLIWPNGLHLPYKNFFCCLNGHLWAFTARFSTAKVIVCFAKRSRDNQASRRMLNE